MNRHRAWPSQGDAMPHGFEVHIGHNHGPAWKEPPKRLNG